MNRPILRTNLYFQLIMGLALSTVAGLPAAAAETAPTGMVAFFTTDSCPTGWKSADFAAGRLVVAVTDGKNVKSIQGTALKDRENRTHTHKYSTTVTLKSKSVSGASSCCNSKGAKSTSNPVTGTTEPSSSNLPFTQLVICEKQ